MSRVRLGANQVMEPSVQFAPTPLQHESQMGLARERTAALSHSSATATMQLVMIVAIGWKKIQKCGYAEPTCFFHLFG